MVYTIDNTRREYTYAENIINGTYLACELEVLACRRFLRDLERQNDPDFPWCYDTTRADRFFQFFERCVDINSPDNATLKLAHFQYFDLGNIYGWVNKTNGIRRYKEALIFHARGNGKSTEAGAMSLYDLTSDKIYPPYAPKTGYFEPEHHIIALAVDREQTKHVRGTAVKMARKSSFLEQQIKVGKGDETKTYIRNKRRGGEITAISREVGNRDGEMLTLIICDEWAAHKEERRLNTLRGSFGKRKQCLLVKITTAGDDAMQKPAKNDYDRCVDILHGRIQDDTYFIIIRQLEATDNPSDFSLYEKSTPMLREKNEYSAQLFEQIKDEYNKAFNGGTEAAKIEFLIKRTNRWQVGSEHKFLNQEQLDKLIASQVSPQEFAQMIKGKGTVVGIDKSVKQDLTAEDFVFNLPDGKIGIYAHGFMPRETLPTHNKTDKLPYESYARKGYMDFIDGEIIDDLDLKQHICAFESDNDLTIKAICADNAFCGQLLIDLAAGRTPNNKAYDVIEVPQTTTHLNEPCMNFIKWLIAGKLVICENELFIQHCANAYAEYDKGGRMKIAKKNKDSYFRIDLLAAALNAIRKIDLLENENILNAIISGTFSF